MHTTQLVVSLLAIYIVHMLMDDGVGPCQVVRRDGMTLLVIDPRRTKLEILLFCADHLTVEERNRIRRAWGEPEVGAGPTSDAYVEGICYPTIPPPLRLPPP